MTSTSQKRSIPIFTFVYHNCCVSLWDGRNANILTINSPIETYECLGSFWLPKSSACFLPWHDLMPTRLALKASIVSPIHQKKKSRPWTACGASTRLATPAHTWDHLSPLFFSFYALSLSFLLHFRLSFLVIHVYFETNERKTPEHADGKKRNAQGKLVARMGVVVMVLTYFNVISKHTTRHWPFVLNHAWLNASDRIVSQ